MDGHTDERQLLETEVHFQDKQDKICLVKNSNNEIATQLDILTFQTAGVNDGSGIFICFERLKCGFNR